MRIIIYITNDFFDLRSFSTEYLFRTSKEKSTVTNENKLKQIFMKILVKFPYWGVLNYADSLCIKISPIFLHS